MILRVYEKFLLKNTNFKKLLKDNHLIETEKTIIKWLEHLKKEISRNTWNSFSIFRDLVPKIDEMKVENDLQILINHVTIFQNKEINEFKKKWPIKCTNKEFDKYFASILENLFQNGEYTLDAYIIINAISNLPKSLKKYNHINNDKQKQLLIPSKELYKNMLEIHHDFLKMNKRNRKLSH